MGGKGGDLGLTKERLKELEIPARRELADAAGTGKRNVFISFAAEDLDLVDLLRNQAKNEELDIDFNDWSVKEPFDSDRAEYIKYKIRERIRQSSVTLVFVSEHTAGSQWVDWEIRESIDLRGKDSVVAVYQGTRPATLPPAIVENDIKVIPWNVKQLDAEIEGAASK